MGKRTFVNAFIALALSLPAVPLPAAEGSVQVRPTNRNYYMATLLGEAEHYAPTFYDDFLITLNGKDVGLFTRVDGVPVDFYWYVESPQAVADVDRAFKAQKAAIDEVSPRILPAFAAYQKTAPKFGKEGLYGQVLGMVKSITSVAPQRVMGDEKVSRAINEALYQYLKSNGIQDLNALAKAPQLINMVVNKFYLLSTTYFYRDFPHVKAYLDRLGPVKERLKKEKRPFKACVFACSTGEEVLSYAVELLEAGVQDFTILASDINEPGLRHAREFRYSGSMIERLPLSSQQKIKKHFELNKALGVWEPKDRAFFRSRIQYVRQDLLENLPANLDPRFAPPYDLVSIMNVLFYLDDPAVQARKDYWARIVNPDGFLILHDFFYSLQTGTLGHEWAFKNFLMINDWVNVRVTGGMGVAEKISFYESAHAQSPSDGTLLALVRAYSLSGNSAKIEPLCERYLKSHPRSMPALRSLWEFRSLNRPAEAARLLKGISELQPHAPDVLDKMAQEEKDRREKDFILELKKVSGAFFASYKSRPREAEALFLFQKPSTGKYEWLRRLLKINALAVLQNHHMNVKDLPDAERVGKEAFRLAKEALPEAPPVLASYLDQLVQDRLGHVLEEAGPAKALEAADEIFSAFGPVFSWSGFSAASLNAHYFLTRGMALDKLGRAKDARAAVDAAVAHFDRAMEMIDELMLSRYFFFYGDAGRAYFIRSKLRAESGDTAGAQLDDARALDLLEMGLSYNPLYGKEVYNWRTELLNRRRVSPADKSGEAPLAGFLTHFSDEYGPYTFSSEIVRYNPGDGSSIEATLLIPDKSAPARPGLVFVHMWARDRNTWWGLPEFLASHGYPSIYMDLRGHGASRFADSAHRVTISDDIKWQGRYKEFVADVLPAIDQLKRNPAVPSGKVILLGASLGAPVGMLSAELRRESVMGLVMMSPALNYFGVDCTQAMEKLSEMPLLVTAEKTDGSFRGAKDFFNTFNGFKSYLPLDRVGHGTDALYRDAGLPTMILAWLEQVNVASASLQKLRTSHPAARRPK